ncbi:MAG: carboxylesterase family protein [Glaciihabitans sp.]
MTASAPSAAPTAHDAPEADTTSGRVRGVWRDGSAAFLGIPFAAAPVGELRFAAPARPERWDGTRDATAYGPTPQRRLFGDDATIPEPSFPGEDILGVNVFTPAPGDSSAGLPVLVWIHGGGYYAGSAASPWYDGAAFNRDGVVTVTLSYRLGFDGFGWIDGAPLNRGVLDQIAGLEWVRDNIASFGGDPDRVTIAGQSAGGGSVLTLLTSPRAEGLFTGVIAQSAAIGALDAAGAEDVGRRFAARMGVTPDLAGWRAVSEEQILDAQGEFNATPGSLTAPDATLGDVVHAVLTRRPDASGLAFSPVIDNEVVVDVVAALTAGIARDIPLVLGTTAHEFGFPTPDGLADALAALEDEGAPADAVAAFQRQLDEVGSSLARSQLVSAGLFRLLAVDVTRARALGGAADRTWLYDFRYRSPVNGIAGHCYEIPFVFDLLDAELVERSLGQTPPPRLAEAMHGAWVRFIAGGNPSWPTVVTDGAMIFGVDSSFDPAAYPFERSLPAR